jgi:hypothetical protein
MYTVDASVWVNGFDQREAGHTTSRQLLAVLRARALPIIVPNLVLAEVAGAISRTRNDPVQVEAFATTLGRLPNVTVVALDGPTKGTLRCDPVTVLSWCQYFRLSFLLRCGTRVPGPSTGGPARLAWGRCGVRGGGPAGRLYLDLAGPRTSDAAGEHSDGPYPSCGARRFTPTRAPIFHHVSHRPVHFCGPQVFHEVQEGL